MICSGISDNIKVILGPEDKAPAFGHRSALQSPEISRAQIAAMLRRYAGSKKIDGSWLTLISSRIEQAANGNN